MYFEATFLLPPRKEGDEIFLVFHPARSRLSSWQSSEGLYGLVWFSKDLPVNVVGLRVVSCDSSGARWGDGSRGAIDNALMVARCAASASSAKAHGRKSL